MASQASYTKLLDENEISPAKNRQKKAMTSKSDVHIAKREEPRREPADLES
jgi:hypothetical protein